MNHERFEQLCAMAAIGEVSSAEFSELNEHLAACEQCREIDADFRRIASHELGAVATNRWDIDVLPDLNESVLLTRVLERAHGENGELIETPELPIVRRPLGHSFWNRPRVPLAAAMVATILACGAVAIGAYQFRDQQLRPIVAQLQHELNQKEEQNVGSQAESDSAMLRHDREEREALQRSLGDAHKSYSALLSQEKVLEKELASTKAQFDEERNQLRDAHEGLQESASAIKELQIRLHVTSLRAQEQAALIEQLHRKLQDAETEATSAAASGLQDGDAKEVFGARDLHIVDVYDVDASGKTKRTFGRVYFAEKRLLLFYAFDLQDKQRKRVAAGFQAWGYRQGNEDKPQNLGLFLMDDPVLSRWVLKVKNTQVLERIDAVFVTLEPPGGSPVPSGRKLLYANLGGPPNHP